MATKQLQGQSGIHDIQNKKKSTNGATTTTGPYTKENIWTIIWQNIDNLTQNGFLKKLQHVNYKHTEKKVDVNLCDFRLGNGFLNIITMASKMVPCVKVRATKPKNPKTWVWSSVPTWEKEKTNSWKLTSELCMCSLSNTQINKYKVFKCCGILF